MRTGAAIVLAVLGLASQAAHAAADDARDWIERDHDLASLHGLPRFQEILARLGDPGTTTSQ